MFISACYAHYEVAYISYSATETSWERLCPSAGQQMSSTYCKTLMVLGIFSAIADPIPTDVPVISTLIR